MDDDITRGTALSNGGAGFQPSTVDRVSFHSLPWEVFMQIIGHLNYRSVLSLSEVNNSFHSSVIPNALVTKKVLNEFLMEVEHFKRYPRHLACFSCLRILPRDSFGRSMRYGGRGKNGVRESKRVTRCCWECAAQKFIYPQNMPVRKGKFVYYLCHTCGEFKLHSERCMPTGCTRSEPAPRSKFETLPDDLQQRIFGMLGYGDALRLARVNRHFAKAVDPQTCDIRSKFLFMQRVSRQIKNYPRLYSATTGCYGCFTFKPMKKFTRKQIYTDEGRGARYDRTLTFTRRCIACLEHLYGQTGRDGSAVARARFHRQVMCSRCREMRYEDQEGSCEGCVVYEAKHADMLRLNEEKREQRRLLREKMLGDPRAMTFDLTPFYRTIHVQEVQDGDGDWTDEKDEKNCDFQNTPSQEVVLDKTSDSEQDTLSESGGSSDVGVSGLTRRNWRGLVGRRLSNFLAISGWRARRQK